MVQLSGRVVSEFGGTKISAPESLLSGYKPDKLGKFAFELTNEKVTNLSELEFVMGWRSLR